jgi:pilus assembly protein CpaE
MVRPLNFVILGASSDEARDLREALGIDQRVRVVAGGDLTKQLYAEVARWRPSAVIITLGAEPKSDWALIRQVNALCPETMVICASGATSPDLILDSLRAGAREFLRLPVIAEELKTVIDRAVEFCAGEPKTAKKRGRVIAVFSNKGGCGCSFIAANLAVAMGPSTTLVDLNLQEASQDLFFGVKPRFSIADFVENLARLDDQLMASFLIETQPNVRLLPAPPDAAAAEDIRAEQIVEVIEILRERSGHVVLDLPHTFDEITIAALDQADEILLALTLDILAARAAQRALAIFGRLNYPREKVRIALNRWNQQSDLDLKHLEKFLGERVSSLIPEDYPAVVNSINVGRPLLASQTSTAIAAELRRLAAVCGGQPEKPRAARRGSLLNSFFRRPSARSDVKLEAMLQRA